jgi:3-oxoacyl-[acyl-carrier protein] reductase
VGEFDGKVAIVTGAARGLGRDYAEFLAEDGGAVVLADVNGEGAERSTKELEQKGARAIGLQVDVTDAASVDAMVATTVTGLGGIDILINNAAIWGDLEYSFQGVLDNDPDYFRTVIDVNLTGTFICSRAVVPAMRERGGGRIVNISSIGRLDVRRALRRQQARRQPAHVRRRGPARRGRHHRQRRGARDDLQRG